jgi:probable rRNA maturation factor
MRCKLELDKQTDEYSPSEEIITEWLNVALAYESSAHLECYNCITIDLAILSAADSRSLNSQYRNMDKPTNILSFNMDTPVSDTTYLLGSLAVCGSIMRQQAIQANKSLIAHWAHIIIHGLFHLLGYDHITDAQERTMASKEIAVLSQLGFNYQLPYTNI